MSKQPKATPNFVWDGMPLHPERDGWHMVEKWRDWRFDDEGPAQEVLLPDGARLRDVWFWDATEQCWGYVQSSEQKKALIRDFRYIGEMALLPASSSLAQAALLPELVAVLDRLLDWEAYLGGWTATCWNDARELQARLKS